jgi:hypothetical protein
VPAGCGCRRTATSILAGCGAVGGISATPGVTVTGAFSGARIILRGLTMDALAVPPSVDVEPAECEHHRGEGAQAGDDQDGKVAGADAAVDLAVADRPVEQ